MPVLAPITAAGRPRSALSGKGREAQSMAFLSCPGIEALYSGVASSRPSAAAIPRRRAATAAGAGTTSKSSE